MNLRAFLFTSVAPVMHVPVGVKITPRQKLMASLNLKGTTP